jgi:hypothetical protein
MKVGKHVEMTRDAVLLTAGDVDARNQAELARLAQLGVGIAPDVLTERRLHALVELLLDTDQQAALELLYQEALERFLTSPAIAEAEKAARQAHLLAPASAFGDAVPWR